MRSDRSNADTAPLHGRLAVAGLGAGLAEIAWVILYSRFMSVSAIEIARQVTASVLPSVAQSALAPAVGVVIHLALSLALVFVFAWVVWIPFARRRNPIATLTSAVVVLTAVWVVNFFLVLPVLNPAFVTLMPYAVTLISKVLFGLAMAWILLGADKQRSGRASLAPVGMVK